MTDEPKKMGRPRGAGFRTASRPAGERTLESDWLDEAACADSRLDFVQPDDRDTTSREAIRRLRNICAGCPVRRECLEYAYEQQSSTDYGVYGGTRGFQRRWAARTSEDPVELLMLWFDAWVDNPTVPETYPEAQEVA